MSIAIALRLALPTPAHRLAAFLSAVTALHTKLWLTRQGRFADVLTYGQTRSPALEGESQLTLVLSEQPGGAIFLQAEQCQQEVMEAIAHALACSTRERWCALRDHLLSQQVHELEQSASNDGEGGEGEQDDLAVLEAALAHQRQILALHKERGEVLQHLLESRFNALDQARRRGGALVAMVASQVSDELRAMLAQAMVPELLQLSSAQEVLLDSSHAGPCATGSPPDNLTPAP